MEENEIINIALEKEIGMNISTAIHNLIKAGIKIEDLAEITNIAKKSMSCEIEKRNIPYEYRFLLINVILCNMLNNSVKFQKAWVSLSEKEKELDRSCKSENKDKAQQN